MENDALDTTSTSNDPLTGVPELKSYLATDEVERTDGLNLVADSVAQVKIPGSGVEKKEAHVGTKIVAIENNRVTVTCLMSRV